MSMIVGVLGCYLVCFGPIAIVCAAVSLSCLLRPEPHWALGLTSGGCALFLGGLGPWLIFNERHPPADAAAGARLRQRLHLALALLWNLIVWPVVPGYARGVANGRFTLGETLGLLVFPAIGLLLLAGYALERARRGGAHAGLARATGEERGFWIHPLPDGGIEVRRAAGGQLRGSGRTRLAAFLAGAFLLLFFAAVHVAVVEQREPIPILLVGLFDGLLLVMLVREAAATPSRLVASSNGVELSGGGPLGRSRWLGAAAIARVEASLDDAEEHVVIVEGDRESVVAWRHLPDSAAARELAAAIRIALGR